MRWYLNNTCAVVSQAGNVTYGKIEPQSRKTDGWMACVAAVIAADNELPDGGEVETMDFGTYTY